MIYSNFTAALDIGSAQISLAIGTKTTNGVINIIDYETLPSSSVKYGKIVNESVVAKEIQSLILKVQQRQKVIIEKVYVTTSGTGLYSERVSVNKALGEGSIVTAEVLKSLDVSDELISKSAKDERLLTQALVYRVDGEKEEQVVGKSCQRIEADYLTVNADGESIDRIKNTLKLAEITMADMFLSPSTVAEAILTQEEKKAGVAAIEIGHASTKIAIYKEGKLQFVSTMPLGCRMIINDLSSSLNISYALAERLLQNNQFGAVCASLVEDAEMELTTKSDIKKIFPTRFIVEVIEARLEEILLNVKHQLEKSGFMNLMISGLVMTGHVVNIKNLSHFVTIKTNFNVRVADMKACLSKDSVHQLTHADAEICGLLKLGKNNSKKEEKKEKKVETVTPQDSAPEPKEKKDKKKIFRGMRDMFEGLFDEEDAALK